jgi:hypothetical protein
VKAIHAVVDLDGALFLEQDRAADFVGSVLNLKTLCFKSRPQSGKGLVAFYAMISDRID